MNHLKEKLTFEDLPEAIYGLIKKIDDIDKKISKTQNDDKNEEAIEFLTYDETAKLMHCSRATLWKYTKLGKIIPRGKGRRRLFVKEEIIAFLNNSSKSEIS